jgi:hypothetical protein
MIRIKVIFFSAFNRRTILELTLTDEILMRFTLKDLKKYLKMPVENNAEI